VRTVSKAHATVRRASNRQSPFVLLRDLGSSNGTYLLADAGATDLLGADRSGQDRAALEAALRGLQHPLEKQVDVLLRNCELFRLGPDTTFQVSIERIAVSVPPPTSGGVSTIMHSADSSASSPQSPLTDTRRELITSDTLGTQRRPLHSFGTNRSQEDGTTTAAAVAAAVAAANASTASTHAATAPVVAPTDDDEIVPIPVFNDTQSQIASIPRTLTTQTQHSNKTASDAPLGVPGDMLPPQVRPRVIVLSDAQTQPPVIVLSDATQPLQQRSNEQRSNAMSFVDNSVTQAATLADDGDDDSERTEEADVIDSSRTVPISGSTQAPPPVVVKRGSGTLDAANAMELLVADTAHNDAVASDDETFGNESDAHNKADDDDDDDGWVETKPATLQAVSVSAPEAAAKSILRRSTEASIDAANKRQARKSESSDDDSPVLQLKLPEVAPLVDEPVEIVSAPVATMPVDVPDETGRPVRRQRRPPVRFVQSLDATDEPTDKPPSDEPTTAEPTVGVRKRESAESVVTTRSTRSMEPSLKSSNGSLKRKSSSNLRSSPAPVEEQPIVKRGRRAAVAVVVVESVDVVEEPVVKRGRRASASVSIVEEVAAVADAAIAVDVPAIAKRGRRSSAGASPPAELERRESDGTSSGRRSTRQSKAVAAATATDVADVAPQLPPVVFMLTACNHPPPTVQETLENTLPVRFTDDPTDGVTHIVTEVGLSRRTEKILCALALGAVRAVVTPAYLQACKRAHRLVSESSFAVVDKQTERRLGLLDDALERAATMRASGVRVLEGIHFWLTPRALAHAVIAPRVIVCGNGSFHDGLPTERQRGRIEVVIADPDEPRSGWQAQSDAGFGIYAWQFVADAIVAQRVDWNANFIAGQKGEDDGRAK
jgi:pSer/pThr/pTyr-binding forkhead associated (FHA) protein